MACVCVGGKRRCLHNRTKDRIFKMLKNTPQLCDRDGWCSRAIASSIKEKKKPKEHLRRINISTSSISEIISTSIIQQQKNKPFAKINVW